ncbi:hypothetical protein KSF_097470 [Reticulibacter mediterranei]|uniref:Uncharacterized protein n=1 Tax=Reticulibacter mediterranei TaxID=2778369 RepID=A0A8J3N623_9CHLR|nr:hypothetical protein [Reticulibacter mediterranei]GHO99699.1 hypothetical protein KSF_097470 [Reticulibacter mediterranei]
MPSERQIFRERALQQYLQKREKEVIPHILSPSLFTCLWIVFSLFVLIALLTLRGQLPKFISSSGVVLTQREGHIGQSDDLVILAFLPVTDPKLFHVGQHVLVRTETNERPFTGTIQRIEESIYSPADIQKRYLQRHNVSLDIVRPSRVAEVKLERPLHLPSYEEGGVVTLQVNVGSQSVLSLLPGIGRLFGGETYG